MDGVGEETFLILLSFEPSLSDGAGGCCISIGTHCLVELPEICIRNVLHSAKAKMQVFHCSIYLRLKP